MGERMENGHVALAHIRLEGRPTDQERSGLATTRSARIHDIRQIRDEVLAGGPNLHVFVFMTEDSPILQVMHSIAKFFDIEAGETSTTRLLASLGNAQYTGHHTR
ncbi:hypothetical protein HJC23_012894 [Cyclotella cryptica]|uniref:Uncharacterized protein n=1 Tax=Cyclotella cryptica TaxID=29204 RepID=A0ABD3Q1N8_9STRA